MKPATFISMIWAATSASAMVPRNRPDMHGVERGRELFGSRGFRNGYGHGHGHGKGKGQGKGCSSTLFPGPGTTAGGNPTDPAVTGTELPIIGKPTRTDMPLPEDPTGSDVLIPEDPIKTDNPLSEDPTQTDVESPGDPSGTGTDLQESGTPTDLTSATSRSTDDVTLPSNTDSITGGEVTLPTNIEPIESAAETTTGPEDKGPEITAPESNDEVVNAAINAGDYPAPRFSILDPKNVASLSILTVPGTTIPGKITQPGVTLTVTGRRSRTRGMIPEVFGTETSDSVALKTTDASTEPTSEFSSIVASPSKSVGTSEEAIADSTVETSKTTLIDSETANATPIAEHTPDFTIEPSFFGTETSIPTVTSGELALPAITNSEITLPTNTDKVISVTPVTVEIDDATITASVLRRLSA